MLIHDNDILWPSEEEHERYLKKWKDLVPTIPAGMIVVAHSPWHPDSLFDKLAKEPSLDPILPIDRTSQPHVQRSGASAPEVEGGPRHDGRGSV